MEASRKTADSRFCPVESSLRDAHGTVPDMVSVVTTKWLFLLLNIAVFVEGAVFKDGEIIRRVPICWESSEGAM